MSLTEGLQTLLFFKVLPENCQLLTPLLEGWTLLGNSSSTLYCSKGYGSGSLPSFSALGCHPYGLGTLVWGKVGEAGM